MNYKEKLEEAKRLYESANADQKYVLESLFPELKESEDEKVRKALVEMVRDRTGDELWVDYNVHKEEVLAWLEKQESVNEIVSRCRTSWYNEGKIAGMAEGLTDDEKYQQGWHDALEKQGEQKPSDKIKPKFKVGDWAVNNGHSYLIADIDFLDNRYLFEIGGYTHEQLNWEYIENVDNKYHLWTIQDAKDGDVLVASDKSIFIYDGSINENGSVGFYIAFTEDMDIILNSDDGCGWEEKDSCHPSTKEQRDLLFQKMHEAGYEWDAEKKELKEIEDEEYNGEDYGIDSLWHAKNILEETLGKVDGYQTDDGILEHKCAIAAVNKLYKQKPWSEEDEDYYDAIITKLEVTQDDAALTDNQMEFLKSLKGRVRPKQEWSEEDEKMIGRIRGIIEAYAFSQSAVDVNGDLCEKKFIDADIWLKSLKEKIGG